MITGNLSKNQRRTNYYSDLLKLFTSSGNANSRTIGNCVIHQHDLYSLLHCRCSLHDLLLFTSSHQKFYEQISILPGSQWYVDKLSGPLGDIWPQWWKLHGDRISTCNGDLLKHALDNLATSSSLYPIRMGIRWSGKNLSLPGCFKRFALVGSECMDPLRHEFWRGIVLHKQFRWMFYWTTVFVFVCLDYPIFNTPHDKYLYDY